MLNFLVISKKKQQNKTVMRLVFTHKVIRSLIDDTERS